MSSAGVKKLLRWRTNGRNLLATGKSFLETQGVQFFWGEKIFRFATDDVIKSLALIYFTRRGL